MELFTDGRQSAQTRASRPLGNLWPSGRKLVAATISIGVNACHHNSFRSASV
ncbi:hypothetical protein DB32_002661 [Sandaracinus amylolyticus]|uniref:Uncharacterized protein n=1 Tax=Sandaracinus amylolyticus TaxID=927083 RepID=A0A0F6W236_9BACT|nr:hypothetical protein DB32_002661 [Sandaracinus amylolyticus]